MSDHTRLGRGGEFDFIRAVLEQDARFRRGVDANAATVVGPGDDCAVITAPAVALTVDLSVEDIHFRRAWVAPEDIGWRAVMASLSDLAAMAARPIGILVSLAVPADDVATFAPRVMAGASDAAARLGAALLGGNLSRSPGPFAIDVVAAGSCVSPVRRSGAHPGDTLWVTGALGGAAAAVAAWRAGREPDADARVAWARPHARVEEAIWLAERGVLRAMIDLSDGLAGDAGHLAAASGVQLVIEPARIPVHRSARAAALQTDAGVDGLTLALSGGEDYDLCFAARSGSVEPLVATFEERFSLALTRVGEIREGEGIAAMEGGRVRPLDMPGFSHL